MSRKYAIKMTNPKNKHQRYVPVSSVLHNILGEYLNIRDVHHKDYLFPNSYDEQLPPSTLRRNIIILTH